uniref:Uncharacterized protein n=1 Tax=Panagrolaimus superbus TaxID=310955 RepID=A0A914ZAJ2_9BILA
MFIEAENLQENLMLMGNNGGIESIAVPRVTVAGTLMINIGFVPGPIASLVYHGRAHSCLSMRNFLTVGLISRSNRLTKVSE